MQHNDNKEPMKLIKRLTTSDLYGQSNWTIPNLNGDEDKEYFFEAYLRSAYPPTIYIKPNGNSVGNSIVSWHLKNPNGNEKSSDVEIQSHNLFLARGHGYAYNTMMRISGRLTSIKAHPKLGFVYQSVINASWWGHNFISLEWEDDSTNITSLVFASTQTIFQGFFEIYKKGI